MFYGWGVLSSYAPMANIQTFERKENEIMNQLQIFNNAEFGNVRTILIDDVPWFVGKDIVDALGYQNGSRDINRHVDEEDRQKYAV